MTYQFLILTLFISLGLTADCNNPLIDTSKAGFLTTPVILAEDSKFCPGLRGKEICCDTTAMEEFVTKMKEKSKKFKD
jgi:hypothetical protein